jgi:hypothetical protein
VDSAGFKVGLTILGFVTHLNVRFDLHFLAAVSILGRTHCQ